MFVRWQRYHGSFRAAGMPPSTSGRMPDATSIRTALIKDGKAYGQAGGWVNDSTPTAVLGDHQQIHGHAEGEGEGGGVCGAQKN